MNGSRILRDAVAEGPVLLRNLDQVDEHVLRTQTGVLTQIGDDGAVERLLLRQGARIRDGELQDDEVAAAGDVQIAAAEVEVLRRKLLHLHEQIFLRYVEGLAQGGVDAVDERIAIGVGLAFDELDANEGHDGLLWDGVEAPSCQIAGIQSRYGDVYQ